MKHRLRILLAAIAALFATPLACFASVNPVLFAAMFNDPATGQFLVGIGVNALVQAFFRKSSAQNGLAPIAGTLIATGLTWLGGIAHIIPVVSMDVAAGNASLAATTAHTAATMGQSAKWNGASGILKETPQQAQQRLAEPAPVK